MARYSRMRGRNRNLITMPEISLTPLIDTALVLLVIFMVATPMMHNSLKIDLPQGKSAEVDTVPQEIIVFMDKQGVLFVNDQHVTHANLASALKKKILDMHNDRVSIQADGALQWEAIYQLAEFIQDSGVEHVAFVGQRPKAA
ncbi:MAG: biopolymer transporter ExbD [Candidatus Babeliaceae bacterium]|jgi:biopolymer transport protein ExbD